MAQEKISIIDSVVVDAGVVEFRSDGIMCERIKDDYTIDVKDLDDITRAVGQMGKEKKYPNLLVAGKYTNITREARDHSTSAEVTQYSSAHSVVIHTLHQKLIANLYFKINKPELPTAFFDNEEKAVAWLKKYQ